MEKSAITTADMLKEEQQQVEKEFSDYYKSRFSGELPNQALAISGGGIRSGSFCMGVMQALKKRKGIPESQATMLEKMRYLSSVSGGGYTGSALSWYQRKFGFFPFGEPSSYSGSQNNPDSIKIEDAETENGKREAIKEKFDAGQSNHILNYIRQHGSYLTPPGLGFVSLIASILRSVVSSAVAYSLLLALFFLGVFFFADFLVPDRALNWVHQTKTYQLIMAFAAKEQVPHIIDRFLIFSLAITLLSLVFWVVLSIVYSLSSVTHRFFSWAYGYRVYIQAAQGKLTTTAAVGLVLTILPIVSLLLYGVEMELQDEKFTLPAFASTIAVIITAVTSLRGKAKASGLLTAIYNFAVIAIFILLLMLASFEIAERTYQNVYHMALLLLAAAVFGFVVNINQISPHKMYRDRLMATFMKAPDEPIRGNVSKRGVVANKSRLSELNNSEYWSPYHLINCNLILVNSPTPKFKGRQGDSFLLSSKFCGSDATGFEATEEFENGQMTLATAFSISGAAVDPNTGNDGAKSSFSNKAVAFLMTFLGARLGYWCYNPAKQMLLGLNNILRPNFVYPGVRSLAGVSHSEDATAIELSDGGHFDNLGLYELIRRRVPLIFVADGGSDPDFEFDSLGSVMSRVRVDFSTEIRFINEEYDLEHLLPGSQASKVGSAAKVFDKKYNLSSRGYALAEISYPKLSDSELETTGVLVYIKSVLTRNLPGDLYAYKAANEAFPFQPTVDQFFDERQMESYRELGYMLTRELLQDEKAMALINSGKIIEENE